MILGQSEYEFYPQRQGGSLEYTFSATNELEDARLVQQVRFTELLLQQLMKALNELDDMYERYDDAQTTIKDLQEQLALEDGDAKEEDPEERPDPINSSLRQKLCQSTPTEKSAQDPPVEEDDV